MITHVCPLCGQVIYLRALMPIIHCEYCKNDFDIDDEPAVTE